ncbi:ABC transporter substrate-binding protein [Caldalkalibacillus mannanilyticus]|uniref:ABC transporter substrate-binding protein n=1 Tax=Caldalkalibacillus mannanilyticus TaxID=1418 RepID=UPI00046A764E|nr:ABC transporter substrate-binding protein [Caldalkalibacillus mannanilyticus]
MKFVARYIRNAYFCVNILLVIALLVGCSTASLTQNNVSEGEDQQGQKQENSSPQGVEEGITIIDHAQREVFFQSSPKRIVSLLPGDMEIIDALGGEIIGRPSVRGEGQELPERLASAIQVGSPHEVDFEKILSLKPDLVIGHAGLNMKDVGTAEYLGLNMLLTNSNSYEKIIQVIDMYGQLLERTTEAKALIQSIEDRKEALQQGSARQEVKVLMVYGTVDTFMAALPTSLAGNLLEQVGGKNIASDLAGLEQYPDYAHLSMERVIEANPEVIYFITHGDPQAVKEKFETELKSNPAWHKVKALEKDQLIFLPHELFGSNPGLKVIEAMEFLKESLDRAGE